VGEKEAIFNVRLLGLSMSSMTMDFISHFHSQRQIKKEDLMSSFIGNKKLDTVLENYTRLLSFGSHKRNLLDQISLCLLDKHQLIKFIVHHSMCLKVRGVKISPKHDLTHPDWFKRLVAKL